jgi:hypothetical protein
VAGDEVPLNVPIPRPLHARLKSKAALSGRTIRRYVVEAIEEKLARDEADDRRNSRRREGRRVALRWDGWRGHDERGRLAANEMLVTRSHHVTW